MTFEANNQRLLAGEVATYLELTNFSSYTACVSRMIKISYKAIAYNKLIF